MCTAKCILVYLTGYTFPYEKSRYHPRDQPFHTACVRLADERPVVDQPSGGTQRAPRAARGVSGSDVTALQAFLAADSRIYTEGTISGYYGALTQKAVQALQQRHNLVTSGSPETTGFGAVGPATRNLIATLCVGGGIPSAPSIPAGACAMGSTYVENGKTADFYSASSVQGSDRCSSFVQTRQCINGMFSGNPAYRYTSCSVSAI